MRIAHVLSSLALGGQERLALDLATEQRRAGNCVLVMSLAAEEEGGLAGAFRRACVEVDSLHKHAGLDAALPLRLTRKLARWRADVVHTHNPQALVYGAPAARLARIPVVHTKHGINPDSTRRQLLRRASATLVDAYVAVTPSLAEVARQGRECNPARIFVIENGIDVAAFAPSREARLVVRAELGIPQDAFVVGSVGRLAPEKNQALLLSALRKDLGRGLHLILVGDGPERGALRQLAVARGVASWVHLVGARTDVSALLSSFDVFALSSRSEGLPLVLLEAMANARPVVATCVGGVSDLIEPGISGIVTPSEDAVALREAVRRLQRDPAWAAELGRAGQERVAAGHGVERMATTYAALYRAVVDARRLERARALSGAES